MAADGGSSSALLARLVACSVLSAAAGAALTLALSRAYSAAWDQRASGSNQRSTCGPSEGGPAQPSAASASAAPAAAAAASPAPAPRAGSALPGVAEGLAAHDEVLEEQLTRNIQFFGREPQLQISRSFVVVVGLGGVGSHAAHLLLRSGVGRLRLVDFDQVTLSSLNRHAVATRADVGTPKATCLAAHFATICPEARVETLVSMYSDESEEAVLSGSPDFVLDCIDNIDTKVALLAACLARGLRVLSSAGAGARADPTRLCVADISDCTTDALARTVRHKLRRLHGIDRGLPVLFSTERPRCGLLPLQLEEGQTPLDLQLVPNFRVRTIPVLGPLPAVFGMAMAAYVLTDLAGQPLQPQPPLRFQPEQVTALLDRLVEGEELRFGSADGVHVDAAEVEWVVKELWRGRSARADPHAGADKAKGLWRPTAGLTLTRWDAARPAAPDNLVLLTFDEAEAHAGRSLAEVVAEEPAWAARVESELARAAAQFGRSGS